MAARRRLSIPFPIWEAQPFPTAPYRPDALKSALSRGLLFRQASSEIMACLKTTLFPGSVIIPCFFHFVNGVTTPFSS